MLVMETVMTGWELEWKVDLQRGGRGSGKPADEVDEGAWMWIDTLMGECGDREGI